MSFIWNGLLTKVCNEDTEAHDCVQLNRNMLMSNIGDITLRLTALKEHRVLSDFLCTETSLIKTLLIKKNHRVLYMMDFEDDAVGLLMLYFYCRYHIKNINMIKPKTLISL